MLLPVRIACRRTAIIRSLFPTPRCLATLSPTRFSSLVHEFTADLGRQQPKFSVPANGIRIVSQPSEFYSMLLDMIRNAERRIFVSSLYIGEGETELVSTLMNRLTQKQSLHLHLLLDLNRSTRPGPSSTAKTLLPLLRAFPDRVHISLFRSPSLRGIMAKLVPPRFNEGWGTWHAKIYGADDELIISGANLNKAYFTNRRDRYIRFTRQPQLAGYCFGFLRLISNISYRLLPTGSVSNTDPTLTSHSYTRDDYTVVWSDPETHPHHIAEKAHQALSAFQASHREKSSESSPSNVLLFPIIQAGQFRIREEERIFQLLFGHLQRIAGRKVLPPAATSPPDASSRETHPLIDLTSGYFGLYKPYQKLILGTPQVEVRVVAASPKANGFFGSKGISGFIPEGYTYLEQKFMNAVKRMGRSLATFNGRPAVELREWEKDGWTYHAKGLWLSPTPDSSPVLSLFGSTNLNSRSADLDTELSFVMVLPEATLPAAEASDSESSVSNLRDQLAREVQGIRVDTVKWRGGERKVRWITKAMVFLVGNKL